MANYKIIKPLAQIPPLRAWTLKATEPRTFDFVNQYKSICVDLELHNHAGGVATYRINNEHDTMDLRATTGIEAFHNCHIEKLNIVSASNVDIIAILAELSFLDRFGALEIS
jgi:hypothetical protein